MRFFFPTLAGLLLVVAIIAVVIGLMKPQQQLQTSRVQIERVQRLAAQLQRQSDRMNRDVEETDRQNVVTTKQDLSFPSSVGQIVIPAGTRFHVVRVSGDNAVVQYNGSEVSLPLPLVDFH
jgi:type II secretory pathway pseudopilin PulG